MVESIKNHLKHHQKWLYAKHSNQETQFTTLKARHQKVVFSMYYPKNARFWESGIFPLQTQRFCLKEFLFGPPAVCFPSAWLHRHACKQLEERSTIWARWHFIWGNLEACRRQPKKEGLRRRLGWKRTAGRFGALIGKRGWFMVQKPGWKDRWCINCMLDGETQNEVRKSSTLSRPKDIKTKSVFHSYVRLLEGSLLGRW